MATYTSRENRRIVNPSIIPYVEKPEEFQLTFYCVMTHTIVTIRIVQDPPEQDRGDCLSEQITLKGSLPDLANNLSF